ncbi:hypothetical protein I0Q91_11760 [Halanaerobiaceae bacterium Z-7014]|uniref:Uncharacterized protein n=1 Tax=Halonatronomonas betaini TaxID=2778430 RepID=A0A931ASR3_9FIRM|nr:hypothetical protein [Halonatronomonas betaini]MBF8437762.1 hypothetical protein [Halonatronomonas betaini]
MGDKKLKNDKKKKINIKDNLVLKYILFFAALAFVFAGGAVIFNYVQMTAFQPERAAFQLDVSGAERSVHENYRNLVEGSRAESELSLANVQDNLILSQSNQLFFLEERKKLLADQYYLIGEINLQNRLEALERSQKQELEEYATRRQNEIQSQILEKQQEINQQIIDLEVGLSEDELASLRSYRRELLSEYRAELLNLRVKLRVLDMTAAREAEIRTRLAEIEEEVDRQVEAVRASLESDLREDIYDKVIELQEEFSDYQSARNEELNQAIEAKKRELDVEYQDRREEWYAELESNYLSHLESQAETVAWLEDNFKYLSRELDE